MTERMTNERMRAIAARKLGVQPIVNMATELIALRARVAELEAELASREVEQDLEVTESVCFDKAVSDRDEARRERDDWRKCADEIGRERDSARELLREAIEFCDSVRMIALPIGAHAATLRARIAKELGQ